MKIIYLDNNATTSVAPEVLESMLPFFKEKYANPSSMHSFGGGISKYIGIAREQVATLLNAKPIEIIFTSCGSESNNMVIQGFCQEHKNITRLITSTVEHPAVRITCRKMSESGAGLTEIGVDKTGLLDMVALRESFIDRNTLASFMWANNETGVIFPIREIAEFVKEGGGFIHTDAVQAVGKVPIDTRETAIDMLSLSGHKLHAPKGIGALFIREGVKLPPLILGGHQEKGFRAGTENVPYIIGLGKACELASERMEEEKNRARKLRNRLEKGLLETCKDAKLNGNTEHRLPNTTNISFEYIEGESILLHLNEKNIAASSGSACSSGSLEPSHVMKAMGVPYTLAHSSIRFSLSRYTTDDEIDTVLNIMPDIVNRLRNLSPYVK